jgi:hypothetical protein
VLPWEDIPRHLLKQIALGGYESGCLSQEQVRRLLANQTRLEIHTFLSEHEVALRYTLDG